jgi:hypothetical protein
MGLVRGEDVVLSVQQYNGVENVYVPFGCARSVTFDISTDFIETSVTESGAFKTFLPSGKQFSGNIEGLAFLNKPAGSNVRAIVTFDYSTIPTGSFPDLAASAYINVNFGSIIDICTINATTFLTRSDYINAIITAINASGTGYTAELGAGNTIIIRSAPGLGDTINGSDCTFDLTVDGTNYPFTIPFAGGVTAYSHDRLGIGWLYDKLLYSELIQLKYYETDDDNHFLYKVCYVYIESINETASFDNMATFTANFKGDGAPNIYYGEI